MGGADKQTDRQAWRNHSVHLSSSRLIVGVEFCPFCRRCRRLWVTAEPHPQFPIGLLQMGIKVTNEAPVGMKAGLRASYQWATQDMLDAVGR